VKKKGELNQSIRERERDGSVVEAGFWRMYFDRSVHCLPPQWS